MQDRYIQKHQYKVASEVNSLSYDLIKETENN